MTERLTGAPRREFQSFHDFPICLDLDALDADIAIIGIPYGAAYSVDEVSNDQTNAPTHIRRYCERALRGLERHDFDIGGTLLDGRPIKVVDCGDVLGDQTDLTAHLKRAELAIRKILAAGALPIVLGGDHGIPIPVFRAYEGRGPITLVQVDAHIDWRDTMHGVREGLSSPIRRASEMGHFDRIFQIGLRAAGSARPEEFEAAKKWGAVLIPDIELQSVGMEAVLERIPDGGQYYLTVDADGMDPTIMPAVAGPAPGGVTYPQIRTLIHGLVRKGRVVGMDIVEITPKRDLNGISAITAGRIIVNLIGMAVRAGYFGK
ncbi:MAG: agmatinase [Parvibaculaceae bacterium]